MRTAAVYPATDRFIADGLYNDGHPSSRNQSRLFPTNWMPLKCRRSRAANTPGQDLLDLFAVGFLSVSKS